MKPRNGSWRIAMVTSTSLCLAPSRNNWPRCKFVHKFSLPRRWIKLDLTSYCAGISIVSPYNAMNSSTLFALSATIDLWLSYLKTMGRKNTTLVSPFKKRGVSIEIKHCKQSRFSAFWIAICIKKTFLYENINNWRSIKNWICHDISSS
jgi:hypothetical protein